MTRLAISLIQNRLQDTNDRPLKFVSGSGQGREDSPLPAAGGASVPASRLVSSLAPPDSAGAHGVTRPTESLVRIIGEPTTPNAASTLAEDDKYPFQWWALGLVGARPVEQKKGADHGIDGRILFRDDPKAAQLEQIIIQVKGGKTGVKDVRDLRGVPDREKAAIGILISLQLATGNLKPLTQPSVTLSPSEGARDKSASAGFCEHKTNPQKFPRLQLRTVKELMEGKGIERPTSAASLDDTFKKAPASKKKHGHQAKLKM